MVEKVHKGGLYLSADDLNFYKLHQNHISQIREDHGTLKNTW